MALSSSAPPGKGDEALLRNRVACEHCRTRRIACFAALPEQKTTSCYRCAKAGVQCQVKKQAFWREDNGLAEVRASLSRLEDVVESLEARTSSDARGTQPLRVDQTDIVSRLTQLCFTSDCLDSDQPVVQTAVASTSSQIPALEELPPLGFVSPFDKTAYSLQQLIDLLPTCDALRSSFVIYSISWFSRIDCLFSPVWAERTLQRGSKKFEGYQANEVAELYALFGFINAGLACRQGNERQLAGQTRRLAEVAFVRMCAALELADYATNPTIEVVRSLHLLSISYLALWSTTDRLRDGLNLIPLTVSLVTALGYHQQATCNAATTASQRYERSAIATAVARASSLYETAYGRAPFVNFDSFDVGPGCWLTDRDLPSALREHTWRPSESDRHSLEARWELAKIGFHMQRQLGGGSTGSRDYNHFETFAEALRLFEADWLCKASWYRESEPSAMVPAAKLHLDERIARLLVTMHAQHLHVSLHMGFVGLTEDSMVAFPGVDYLWHRSEAIKPGRQLTELMSESIALQGPFASHSCVVWGCLMSMAAVAMLHPDDAAVAEIRQYFQTWFHHVKIPFAAQATVKVAQLVTLLLNGSMPPGLDRPQSPTKRQRLGSHLTSKWSAEQLTPEATIVSTASESTSEPLTRATKEAREASESHTNTSPELRSKSDCEGRAALLANGAYIEQP